MKLKDVPQCPKCEGYQVEDSSLCLCLHDACSAVHAVWMLAKLHDIKFVLFEDGRDVPLFPVMCDSDGQLTLKRM